MDAYRTAIELAVGTADRIDYILEAAQWMSAYGLSRTDISEMLLSALDELYEKDEMTYHAVTDALYDKRGSVDVHTQTSPMVATLSQIEGSGSMTASRSYDASSTVERKSSTQQIPRAGASSRRRDSDKDGDRNHSSSSSSGGGGGGGSNGSNIDDEGEMLSPAEVAQVQCTQQARTQIQTHTALKTDAARSSSSLPPFAFKTETETETEEDNEDLLLNGEGEGEGEDSVGCEIRLKKKCSWAVKPFRYCTVHTYVRTFMPISVCLNKFHLKCYTV